MKRKLIGLAVASALAVAAAPSYAAIAGGSNGEFFLNIYDVTANKSYNLDLGILMGTGAAGNGWAINNSGTGVTTPGAMGPTGTLVTPLTGTPVNLSLDANFNSFLAAVNIANAEWNIVGVDTISNKRLFTTIENPAAGLGTVNQMRIATTSADTFRAAINTTTGGTNAQNFSSFVSVGGAADNAAGASWRNDMGGTLAFDNAAGLNQSLYFAGMFENVTTSVPGTALALSTSDNAGISQFDVVKLYQSATGDLATWRFFEGSQDTDVATLAGSYYLKWEVAPIPEPSTWVMLAAGLIGLGAVARRRARP